MTYLEATNNAIAKRAELQSLLGLGAPTSQIIAARGRYIAALQAQKRAAINEARDVTSIDGNLHVQLEAHKRLLDIEDRRNRRGGNYSMIKEASLGFRSLTNSINSLKHARNDTERQQAGKDLINSIGKNLKNTLKAPVIIASRILSTSLVATVIFAPISIGAGILHAAWTCTDSSPSPYDNTRIKNMSKNFQSVCQRISNGMKRL